MSGAWAHARKPAIDVVKYLSQVVTAQCRQPETRLRPLVLCGPSGVGKSYVIRRLVTAFPSQLRATVSTTTRPPRGKEKNGIEYHFVSEETFDAMFKAGKFIEADTAHGNRYGMSVDEVG